VKVAPQLMQQFIAWAKASGKPRPTTSQGMDLLFAEFMNQAAVLGQQQQPQQRSPSPAALRPALRSVPPPPPPLQSIEIGQPVWDEIPDDKQTIMTWDGVKSQIVDGNHAPDDFDEMVARREQAMIEGGHDDLAREAILMGDNHAALTAAAPFTRDNPTSATNTPLGNRVNIAINDLKEVARWVGDDAETTPVTVSAGIVQQNPNLTFGGVFFGQLRPFARVQWGTRGYLLTADIDLGTGFQFTICASTVILQLGMNAAAGTTTGFTVDVAGMLSFKPCVRTAPLTRTVYIDAQAGAGATSAVLAVPNSAKKVTIWRSAPNNQVDVFFIGLGGNTTTGARRAASGVATVETDNPVTYELPGNTVAFQVQNNGAGATDIMAVFELGI
jgi:hypothetical protein